MAGAFTHNGNVVEGLPSIASQINYSNTSSGMQATQVQAAIDELNTNKQPKTDNNLTTTSKETTGAINELKSGLTGHITTYDNVTIAAGSTTWVTNMVKNKVYCAYAKTSDVMAYFAEAIESDSLQLYARNFGNDSITTTIYLKEIG